MLAQHEAPTEQKFSYLFNFIRAKESTLTFGDSFLNRKVPHDKPLEHTFLLRNIYLLYAET